MSIEEEFWMCLNNMDDVDSGLYRLHSLIWVILLVVVIFCSGCSVYKTFDF